MNASIRAFCSAITGNGDIRPCCLLLNPDVPPLRRGKIDYSRQRIEILEEQCVKPTLCWLKNIYFRGDDEF